MSVEATAGGPTWRVLGLWTALYVVASAAMCAPFLPLGHLARMADWGRCPADQLDAGLARALADRRRVVARRAVLRPRTRGTGLLGADDRARRHGRAGHWLAGPHVAFNLVRLAIPVANALVLALLVWHYLRDARGAVVAGFALAFAYS